MISNLGYVEVAWRLGVIGSRESSCTVDTLVHVEVVRIHIRISASLPVHQAFVIGEDVHMEGFSAADVSRCRPGRPGVQISADGAAT